MPVFEYVCTGCGMAHEVIVLRTEEPPSECPSCGAKLRRCWSRVGVQLMGWDFARNDALLRSDRRRKPFRQIRDKAAELFD
jgi:putative FmdB family regulatory protein